MLTARGAPSLQATDFNIAIICALAVEASAVESIFDEFYDIPFVKAVGDTNSYTLGRIGSHKIVLAYMPRMGKVASASVSASFRSTFSEINLCLVVGVCGGAPRDSHTEKDIFLGDIIVSTAVIQYDFVRQYPNGTKRKDTLEDNLGRPSAEIRGYLAKLKTKRSTKILEEQTSSHLLELSQKPDCHEYLYPGAEDDILYSPDFRHKHHNPADCQICANAKGTNDEVCSNANDFSCQDLKCMEADLLCQTRIIRERKSANAPLCEDMFKPRVHLGRVGSGDMVMKSGTHRDDLVVKDKVIGFEMEGAGVWDNYPTVVIKGVCDYADCHKSKKWQPYAAGVAAACVKAFLKDWTSASRPSGSNINQNRNLVQAFRNINYESQKNRIPRAYPSTCQWCLNSPEYTQWRKVASKPLFLLSAGPGCGKSVLSRKLVDEFTDDSSVTAYYFFSRTGGEHLNKASTALCAILHQLFDVRPDLIHLAEGALQANGEKLCENYDKLWDLFVKVANEGCQSGSIICVVDGFDECAEVDRFRLLEDLNTFVEEQATASRAGRTKFFITTRPDLLMERKLRRNMLKIELSGDRESMAISEEINHVIRTRMRELRKDLQLENDVAETLLKHLTRIPHRTYLWVALIFDEIFRALHLTKKSLTDLIQELPKTVSDVYESILQRVANRDEAKKVLQITLVAQRPLSLKELDVVLAINDDTCSLASLDRKGESEMNNYIRLLCGAFITVHEGMVYFLHETAREFLVKRQERLESPNLGFWANSFSTGDSHAILARSCMRYLLFEEFCQNPLYISLSIDHSRVLSILHGQDMTDDVIFGTMTSLFDLHSQLIIPESVVPTDLHADDEELKLDTFGFCFKLGRGYERSIEAEKAVRKYTAEHDFLEYAAVYWHLHFREAGADLQKALIQDALHLYDIEKKNFSTWFSIYWATHPAISYPHFTALTIAMAFGHDSVIPLLLEGRRRIEDEDPGGRQAIHWAAAMGNFDTMLLLIHNGAKVDSQDWHGRSPLHLATLSHIDRFRKIEALLQHGASVNAVDAIGLTPLHLAYNDVPTAMWLIEKGGDVNRRDRLERSPLSIAAANGNVDVAKGVAFSSCRACVNKDSRIIDLSDAKGSETVREKNPSSRDLKDAEIAHVLDSVKKGDLWTLRQYLEHDFLIKHRDSIGDTALHLAARSNQVDVLEFLVKTRANINVQNLLGQTPLHQAVQHGHLDAIRYLLEANNGRKRLRNGKFLKYPRGNAVDVDPEDCLGLTPLWYAIAEGHMETVRVLVRAGANVNFQSVFGFTPLFRAVTSFRLDIVELLVRNGAIVNSPERILGRTPLIAALTLDDGRIANYLLEHGADSNSRHMDGHTPLSTAVENNKIDMVLLLLDYGANVMTEDSESRTLLHSAVDGCSSPEIFSLLLDKGVKMHARDKNGMTALDYAVLKNLDYAVKLLLEAARKQRQILSPKERLIPLFLETIDCIHDWMRNQILSKRRTVNIVLRDIINPASSAFVNDADRDAKKDAFVSLCSKPLNKMRLNNFSVSMDEVPDAMTALEQQAAILQGETKIIDDGSVPRAPSEKPSFDRNRAFQTTVRMAKLFPEKGQLLLGQNPLNRTLSVLHKRIMLYLKNESEEGLESNFEQSKFEFGELDFEMLLIHEFRTTSEASKCSDEQLVELAASLALTSI